MRRDLRGPSRSAPPAGAASVVALAALALVATHCGEESKSKDRTTDDAGSSGGGGGRGGGGQGDGGGLSFDAGAGAGGLCATPPCGAAGGDDSGGAGLPFCGDGKVALATEECDDGDSDPGDGCSATCQVEADFVCPNPGQSCVSTVRCGDSKISGAEQCDDGNGSAQDGCSATCQIETGWACPFVGVRCVAARCGDSIVVGLEECDDGGDVPTDGCDGNCRLEDGFKCDTPGQRCAPTICRDGAREGTEQCDDGNFDLGDGCTPFCKVEPSCANGPCVSACGDGIRLGGEGCDDGNRRSGDGCSDVCAVEMGFYCEQPPLPPEIEIPLVVRDFAGLDPMPAVGGTPADYDAPNHVDFEIITSGSPDETSGGIEDGASVDGGTPAARIVRAGAGSMATGRGLDLGQPGETFQIQHLDGTSITTVSLAGKPVYAQGRSGCDKTALPEQTGTPPWDKCTPTTMDADSFHSWYVDRDSAGDPVVWPNFLGRGSTELERLTLLRGSFDAAGAFTAGGNAYTYDSRYMQIDGTVAASDGFYPIDDLGNTGMSCSNTPHNFHFTSEVRFWFQYAAAQTPQLDFSGDDDVWVYVNGHLALDIGGIHGREAKSFVVDPANATAWGLEDGNVYEIAVFQAERNQCGSNYWLTVEGFNTSKSVCESRCGDGIIAGDELCDDGPDNQATNPPDYGKCGADCKTRGPHCGDARVDASHEACDDGVNLSVYDFDGTGCAPGCVRPPRCGDSAIQSPQEECDDGVNDARYGGCTGACLLAPRCGDSVVQAAEEECDEGPAGNATCTPDCKKIGPR